MQTLYFALPETAATTEPPYTEQGDALVLADCLDGRKLLFIGLDQDGNFTLPEGCIEVKEPNVISTINDGAEIDPKDDPRDSNDVDVDVIVDRITADILPLPQATETSVEVTREIPATGTGEVVAISALGTALIGLGIALKYISTLRRPNSV